MASTTQNDARELTSKLWAMANDLRGKMDASEYRDYILGFIFYRYLSKRQERYLTNSGLLEFTDTENSSNPQDVNNAFARQAALDGLEDWREDLALQNGFAIDPEYTWTTIINKVQTQTIRPDDYQNLFSQFKANALLNTNATEDFKDVFDYINLMDSSLGNSVSARAKALSQLVERIDSIDFHDDSGHDILGDVYEYLIAEFAGASGKKAGEFYTPHEVSILMSEIVAHHLQGRENIKIYDPTSGSGSLLINIGINSDIQLPPPLAFQMVQSLRS